MVPQTATSHHETDLLHVVTVHQGANTPVVMITPPEILLITQDNGIHLHESTADHLQAPIFGVVLTLSHLIAAYHHQNFVQLLLLSGLVLHHLTSVGLDHPLFGVFHHQSFDLVLLHFAVLIQFVAHHWIGSQAP
jgi:hypothetical protein